MKRSIVALAASVCLVALLGAAAPAHAAFATFVSGSGVDGPGCTSPTTAFRQIGGATGALSKTDTGGVVHVLPASMMHLPSLLTSRSGSSPRADLHPS